MTDAVQSFVLSRILCKGHSMTNHQIFEKLLHHHFRKFLLSVWWFLHIWRYHIHLKNVISLFLLGLLEKPAYLKIQKS